MLNSVKIKRNSKCPCGSGKKLKHCCLKDVKEIQQAVDAGMSSQQIMRNQIFGLTPMGNPRV